ncbi:MAG TPA: cupredoxin domain-containing protein [Anaerolineae bacterium]
MKKKSSRRWSLITAALAALAIAFVPAPMPPGAPIDRTIRIEAGNFEYAPAQIDVNLGERVTIDLVSKDVVHGLYLDGYDLNLTADPGQPKQLAFIADKPGTFRFRCSVTCGALHPFMIGKLTVGPDWTLLRAIGLAVLAAFAGVWIRQTEHG